MKNIFVLLLSILALTGCKDEAEKFAVTMPEANVSFEPTPGGAIMYYKFPADSDIFGLKIKYRDCNGTEITKIGTYASNQLEIKGFIESETDVPIEVSLINSKSVESDPVTMKFSTNESGAKAVFQTIEITPFWKGFKVTYDGPQRADGYIHIGKLGINPVTQKEDTLLLRTEIINQGENKFMFSETVDKDTFTTDVVVWTEDFRGNFVSRKLYPGIEGIDIMKMDLSDAVFTGSSEEYGPEYYPYQQTGIRYLFDGDTNGVTQMTAPLDGTLCAFVSKSNAVPGEWFLDLGSPKVMSNVRFYTTLNYKGLIYYYFWPGSEYGPAEGHYYDTSPNHIVIYGSEDQNEWVELGEFYQSQTLIDNQRWNYPWYDAGRIYQTPEELAAADPCFCDVNFDFSDNAYRYLRIYIKSTFGDETVNKGKRVSFSELEVYVKKE